MCPPPPPTLQSAHIETSRRSLQRWQTEHPLPTAAGGLNPPISIFVSCVWLCACLLSGC